VRGYLDPRVTQCDEAESGEDALVMMHTAANAGSPYALVVLDYHMPDMDGIELAAAIRATPSLRSARLVMLTSAAAQRSAARRVEVDAHLTKPVRRASLLETVVAALDGAGEPRPAAEPAPERPAAPVVSTGRRVLVAEDNQVNQLVIGGMLAKRGYEADVVTTGRAALDALDRERHVAVLMDVQMPELDGMEATKQIRTREAGRCGRRTPVLALTANTLVEDRYAGFEAGMDGYLIKPLDRERLTEALAGIIPASHIAA
jgi:CheY-like chemotaxis protein